MKNRLTPFTNLIQTPPRRGSWNDALHDDVVTAVDLLPIGDPEPANENVLPAGSLPRTVVKPAFEERDSDIAWLDEQEESPIHELPGRAERDRSGIGMTASARRALRELQEEDSSARALPVVGVGLAVNSPSNLVASFDGEVRGVFVETYRDLRLDELVRVRIHLPGGVEVRAQALVEWMRSTDAGGEPVGVGLRFTDIKPGDASWLQAFAERRQPLYYEA